LDLKGKKSKSPVIAYIAAAAIAAFVLFASVFKFGPFSRNKLMVHIENVGDMEFNSLVVSVTGGGVMLGSLLPGHKKESVVDPTGESTVKIAVTDLLGEVRHFEVGGYIEHGFVGDIWVKMTHDRVVSTEVDVSIH
jgi:hypothetical protein